MLIQADDLGDMIDDTSFLNSLQNGVNRWIKEIRKVTRLEREPSSGTSLQEITFWINLERALQKINQKRDSEEIALTLEALKSGKRFQATVAFDADTGSFILLFLKTCLFRIESANVYRQRLQHPDEGVPTERAHFGC